MPVSTLRIPFAFPDGGVVINAMLVIGPDYQEIQEGITTFRFYWFHVSISYSNRTKVSLPVVIRYRYYDVETTKAVTLPPGTTSESLAATVPIGTPPSPG